MAIPIEAKVIKLFTSGYLTKKKKDAELWKKQCKPFNRRECIMKDHVKRPTEVFGTFGKNKKYTINNF